MLSRRTWLGAVGSLLFFRKKPELDVPVDTHWLDKPGPEDTYEVVPTAEEIAEEVWTEVVIKVAKTKGMVKIIPCSQ